MSAATPAQRTLRQLIDHQLLHGGDWSVGNFFIHVRDLARKDGVEWNPSEALSYWAALARLGVIDVCGGATDGSIVSQLQLSASGRAYLESGDIVTHDPTRYIGRVRTAMTPPDPVVLLHADEAVRGWVAGLNRSCAVMLGCASERLVLILAEGIAASGLAPWAAGLSRDLGARESDASRPTPISTVFDHVRVCVLELKKQRRLSWSTGDALERRLSAIFDSTRGLRNDAGHPSGVEVSSDDAHARLLLFPGYCEFVSTIRAEIGALAPAAVGGAGEEEPSA